MARLFDDGSSEYIQIESAVVASPPFVLSAWGYSDNSAAVQCLIQVADKDVANHYEGLFFAGDETGDPVRHICLVGGSNTLVDTSSGYSSNTWHHACSIVADSDDRRVYIDGANEGTSATDLTPLNLDRTSIGRTGDDTPAAYMSGRIAEAAIWDLTNWAGATGADKANNFKAIALPGLALGYSPLFWPIGLVAYWPLGGIYGVNSANAANGDLDRWGEFNMDPQNTPSVADHPTGLIYPRGGIVVPSAAGAAPASIVVLRRRRECA